jgi:phytoene dehydrogenase-like protein
VDAAVRSIDVSGGRTTGVTLESGEQVVGGVVISGAHPRTTVLELVGEEHFPDEVGTDMRRYRTRGGSVKINCILSEPPRYTAGDEQLLRTGVAICPSLDYLERAWQDAVRGEPARAPYLEVEVPTSVDPSLTDDGSCVMTMFTQYGPYRARGVRRALSRHPVRARAERPRRARGPRGARTARPGAHLRPHRWLDLPG